MKMDDSLKMQVILAALTLGPLEDIEANIKTVMGLIENPALWPEEPKHYATSQSLHL